MNAWVFRHLDELQRIYAEPTPDLPTVAPVRGNGEARARGAEEGSSAASAPSTPAAPPGTSGEADPFADDESPDDASGGPRPGAVIRHETPEGPDVLLIPRGRCGRRGSRRL